jgi:hypothetical protein
LSGLFCLGHSTARWLCRLTPRPSMVQSEGPLRIGAFFRVWEEMLV